jgi:ADP-ribose pyrophosphatase YjhB (NUDIX family)
VTLLAAWRYPDRAAAMRAEAHFKRLPRDTKAAWVEGRWPFMEGRFAFDVIGGTERYHFCPKCGGRLALRAFDGAEVLACETCGRYHYINAKPCAGTLILRGDKVLLVHRRIEPYQGYWDIPGGFMGETESPEACAVREAEEETGLSVHLVDFLGFYMDHYDFQDESYSILNMYFVAEAPEGMPRAADDADGFDWFPLAALPDKIAFEHELQVLEDLKAWVRERQG